MMKSCSARFVLSEVRFCASRNNLRKIISVNFSSKSDVRKSKIRLGNGKYFESIEQAISDIPDGAKLLVGGFGLNGWPQHLIDAIGIKGCKNLTVVAFNVGVNDVGLNILLSQQQIKRLIASYVGENQEFGRQYLNGNLELELIAQGTLAERIRAGGAGVPAFFTPASCGTIIQTGNWVVKYDNDKNPLIFSERRHVKEFNGRKYVMETALTGDYALIRAWKADRAGNLVFKKSSKHSDIIMSKAAEVTIVEAEEIVDIGQIDPNDIHVPGIYVDRVVKGTNYDKYSEITKSVLTSVSSSVLSSLNEKKERILRRAALEFKNNMYVNLGLGLPILTPHYLKNDVDLTFHFDSGILNFAYDSTSKEIDPDLFLGRLVSLKPLPGASFFGADENSAIIRGGHLDLTILGGMQVSKYGDLANWVADGLIMGMGGSMDLVTAPEIKVIVTMEHTTRNGSPKILENCTLPLAGQKCVDMIITDLAVFEVNREKGLHLIELAPNVDLNEVISLTGCEFSVSEDLKVMGQITN